MAAAGNTAEALARLKVDILSDEWVKAAWDGHFMDLDPLDIAVEEEIQSVNYHLKNLQALRAILRSWISKPESPDGQGFWTVLVDNEISYRHLVAMLAYIMETGLKRISNGAKKQAGIWAANIYINFVTLPGSGAFKVFHPVLYEKAVKFFDGWGKLDVASQKKSTGSQKRASQQTGGRRKGKRARSVVVEEFEDEEESEEEEGEMSSSEVKAIHDALWLTLKDLVEALDSNALCGSQESGERTVEVLTNLLYLEPDAMDPTFENFLPIQRLNSIPQLSYRGLELVIKKSGSFDDMVACLFKNLLPGILIESSASITRPVAALRQNSLAFILHLKEQHKDNIWNVLRRLMQNMLAQVPDKTEYRLKAAEGVVQILKKLDNQKYATFIEWLYRFSRHSKISYRVAGLEVFCLLVTVKPRTNSGDVPEDQQGFLDQGFLLQHVLSRCNDIAPTVRARAIQGFTQCVDVAEPALHDAIKAFLTPRIINRPPLSRVVPTPMADRPAQEIDRTVDGSSGPANETEDGQQKTTADNTVESAPGLVENADNPAMATPAVTVQSPFATIHPTPGVEISLMDGDNVKQMLRTRAGDAKVNVRKAAIQAMESVVRLDGDMFNKQDLVVIADHARDPALSIRKQALQSMSNLLMALPENAALHKVWLEGVLPRVMDREGSVQEKCLEMLEEVIISNIAPLQRSNQPCHKMVWSMLNIIAGNEGEAMRRYMQKAFVLWMRAGKVKPSVIGFLKTHIDTVNNKGAWMMLDEIAPSMGDKLNYDFVMDYWRSMLAKGTIEDKDTFRRVLSILGHMAKNLSPEVTGELVDSLKQQLKTFSLPPEIISVTVEALYRVGQIYTKQKELEDDVWKGWFNDLLKMSDAYLSKVILEEVNEGQAVDEDKVVVHLFTLGEVAQLIPEKVPKKIFMLVQSVIAAPVISEGSTIEGSQSQTKRSSTETPDNSNPSSMEGSQGASNESPTSTNNCTPSQGDSQGNTDTPPSQFQFTQYSQFPAYSQAQFSQFRGSRMSAKLRAVAFITHGKLCLQNEDVAKKTVAAMARELEVSSDFRIRNNVVMVLCDLCVRYSTVVDLYVPNIACCLRDESSFVRYQTLILLTRLLQEDFLKWKGSLFYRYVVTLIDEEKSVSDLSRFCLTHLLPQRHPNMFFQHFIESIFHFNAYTHHASYNKFKESEREVRLFEMAGAQNFEKRMTIYRFLLDSMTDEHRFQLTAKLTQEVLGAVVDDILPHNEATHALLRDVLSILSSKEIKLHSMKSKPEDEDVVEEQDMAQAVVSAARKNILTKVVKRNVIENVVPIILGLKKQLEEHRSPVVKDVMLYLQEIMKDYKTEVQDILAADKQLAKEVEFDLRRFEQQQQAAVAAASPSNRNNLQKNKSPQTVTFADQEAGSPETPPVPVNPFANIANHSRSSSNTPEKSPTPNGAEGKTPVRTPGGVAATPQRPMSLATVAIMNSAHKAMERARRLSAAGTPGLNRSAFAAAAAARTTPKPKSPTQKDKETGTHAKDKTPASKGPPPSSKDPSPASKGVSPASQPLTRPPIRTSSSDDSSPSRPKKVGWADHGDSDDVFDQYKTPAHTRTKPVNHKRAISTPAGNMTLLGNLTFNPGDYSALLDAPSPIPLTSGLKRDPGTRHDVIMMFSPDHPRPKPSKWNVKSPMPAAKENRRNGSKNDEDKGDDEQEARHVSPLRDSNQGKSVKSTTKTSQPRRNRSRQKISESEEAKKVTNKETEELETSTSRRRSGRLAKTPQNTSVPNTSARKGDLNSEDVEEQITNSRRKSGRLQKSVIQSSDEDSFTTLPRRSRASRKAKS